MMAVTNERFGEAVRRVMDERPGGRLSLRQVAIRTGVDYETLSRMRHGVVPRMDKVIQFARGMGLDVDEWLALAGYEPIGPTDAEELVEGLLDRASRHPEELTYEPDLESVRIEASGGPEDILNLPPETRQQIERILRALLSRERRRRR